MMPFPKKRSFFERLTGGFSGSSEMPSTPEPATLGGSAKEPDWLEESQEEGELAVDVYQTPTEIVVKTMVSGVKPEDLEIAITREMVTIKGRRELGREVSNDDYFQQELYWGAFSRTILLPVEVDVEESEAMEKHGLLTVRLPKIDKKKTQSLKVKSI